MDVRLLFSLAALLGRGADLVGGWLLTYAVHSTVLLGAAWLLVSRRQLRWSPAARHAIWCVALVAGFVTATLQLATPWTPVGGAMQLPLARSAVTAVQVMQHDVGLPAADAGGAGGAAVAGGAGGAVSTRVLVVGVSASTMAVAAWALVTLVLVGRLALAHRRLRLALADRREVGPSLAAGALRHLLAEGGVRRAVSLSVSDALQAPAAIPGDEIVLPARALRELSLAEQEGVLAHELAHVVRRDTLWLQLAAWIERLAWFQPLNRVARRQLQYSAEFAADAWAVEVTREPLRLAKALARVAEWVAPDGASHASLAPGADGSPLIERVRRLTSPGGEREWSGHRAARLAMLAAAVVATGFLPRIQLTGGHEAGMKRVERFESDTRASLTGLNEFRVMRTTWLGSSAAANRPLQRVVIARRVTS